MNKIKIDHFKDISFTDPSENILYDDVLLSLAEQGQLGNTLRLWESPVYFIVLGRTGKLQEDVSLQAVKAAGVPVLRRSSGGGTVLQGQGCLNFSFVVSKEKTPQLSDLRASYHIILQGVLSLLNDLGVRGVFRPTSDLALEKDEKKFSGNAQRRGRHFILHHGTLLYDFDLSKVSYFLRMPKEIPEYRKEREHADFIANICVSKKDLIENFKGYYALTKLPADIKPTVQERQCLEKFLQQRSPVLKF